MCVFVYVCLCVNVFLIVFMIWTLPTYYSPHERKPWPTSASRGPAHTRTQTHTQSLPKHTHTHTLSKSAHTRTILFSILLTHGPGARPAVIRTCVCVCVCVCVHTHTHTH